MAAVIISRKKAAKKKKQQSGVHDAPALIYVSLSLPSNTVSRAQTHISDHTISTNYLGLAQHATRPAVDGTSAFTLWSHVPDFWSCVCAGRVGGVC